MTHKLITSDEQLTEYCAALASADYISFDTEFVSEDTYRPQLCLIQVATDSGLAVIDSLSIENLRPFWEVLTAEGHETIVHAGREELRFCLNAVGVRPHDLFDVQLAAGMIGLEYPASYAKLINRLLGKTLGKGETRTDWRRRPLSSRQIDYALQDVVDLKELRDSICKELDRLNRRHWLQDELQRWQLQIETAEGAEQWRRVSGVSSLSERSLAVARELWRWRDAESKERDTPPRRVLRDDLLVELARRQSADMKRIQAIRGMEFRHLRNHIKAIAAAIELALAIPANECPKRIRRGERAEFKVVTQFLLSAKASICRSQNIAPGLVGTVDDISQYVAHRLDRGGKEDRSPPSITQGWRGELIGNTLERLLNGELAVRISNPRGENPLSFDELNGDNR